MIAGRRVAAVVPAYGVERQIAGVIAAMPPLVDEIVVVDDGSRDRSAGVVEALRDPRVTLLKHARNRGVGAAMATGFSSALERGADILVKCDGDGQMDPADIPALVAPLVADEADYAKGCRFHHLSELRSMPAVRLLGNLGLTFLTKLASGYWQVLDPQNGFVAIRAETLRRLPIGRLARGYFFENDMLIRLNCLEARVWDVPMPARYGDETSSLRPFRVLVDFPLRLLAGLARRVFWRYVFYDVSPIAVFLLLGGLLTVFGATFGAYHWIDSARAGRVTPTGTVMVATLPLIVGFQLLLQALVLDIQASPRARGHDRGRPQAERE